MLLEPKFLRYHNLLEDHFGYRQGDEPGAAYLEQWQELKRNIRHMNRFQKREKLRELNKMFEANKGKFDMSNCSVGQTRTFQQRLHIELEKGTPGKNDEVSYHPDWRTYCKE